MDFCAKPPRVSGLRQVLNVIGCLCIFPLYRAAGIYTRYPAVVDLLISILFAEYCRFSNEGRRIALNKREEKARDSRLDEGDNEAQIGLGPVPAARPRYDAIAMIVGWREDPDLWRRCLESYKAASGWAFMVVGIDGDGTDDEEMIDVFRKVCERQLLREGEPSSPCTGPWLLTD